MVLCPLKLAPCLKWEVLLPKPRCSTLLRITKKNHLLCWATAPRQRTRLRQMETKSTERTRLVLRTSILSMPPLTVWTRGRGREAAAPLAGSECGVWETASPWGCPLQTSRSRELVCTFAGSCAHCREQSAFGLVLISQWWRCTRSCREGCPERCKP